MRTAVLIVLLLAPACLPGQPGTASSTPAVIPIDAGGLQALRDSARGNVVLVNFWATWCAPCIEEFPNLLKLRQEEAAKGLTVIFVSIDRPSQAGTTLARFLKNHGVTFTTYIKKAGDDEGFINAVDKEWSGALPATFIYDRAGKLAHFLLEAQSLESFRKHIQPLLAH